MRILLLEDSRAQARLLLKGLEKNGCTVTHTETIAETHEAYAPNSFDALILDRWVPDGDGIDVLRTLREAGDETPAIILTSMGELNKRLEGLRAGADDYMAKPFHLEELLLRLRRITNRGRASTEISCGPVQIDQLAHRVWVGEEEIILTVTEFNLLAMLAGEPGRLFTHAELLQQVWGLNHDPGTNRVAVYIRHLRMKIGGGLIHTVRGRGYTIDPERSIPKQAN